MAKIELAEKPVSEPKLAVPKWLLIFVVYFFFGLINGTVIGLTPENEFLNGFAQFMFFWSPLIVTIAAGSVAPTRAKKILSLLAIIPTLWFALLPTVMSGAWSMMTTGANPSVTLVSKTQDHEWKLCKYHFEPKGFGEPNDYQTKERAIGWGFKIVRKL